MAQTSELQPRSHAEPPGRADVYDCGSPETSCKTGRRTCRIDLIECILDEGFEGEALGAQAEAEIEKVEAVETHIVGVEAVIEACAQTVFGSQEAACARKDLTRVLVVARNAKGVLPTVSVNET